ncbi:Unknown protein [Striga hermonthica]|uniref:KIB1-4 beta-propeller domain-containing protein n=1 Tax=Striga hermonthica TaxID=68872 RepID=A0A9N7NMY8_STRHE|nr:Unknown protein [Striga hermonthica]
MLSSAFRLLTWTLRPSNPNLGRGVRAMSAAAAAPSRVVKSPPWMMLPPSFDVVRMVNHNLYSLGHDRVLSFDGGSTSSRYEKLETSVIVGSSHGWLALFNPTNSDLFLSNPLTGRHVRWTRIGTHTYPPYNDVRRYEDMVYSSSENLFFCLTQIDSDDLEAWDLTDPTSPRLMAPDGSCVDDSERDGEYPYKTLAFDVHKIDPGEGGGGKLSYVDWSLSGLAMFVGLNHSCAVMATNGGLKPDSIYFTDDKVFNPRNSNYTDQEEKMYGGHDIGVYDYGKKTISPCYYPCDVGSLKRIMPSPIWFTLSS